MLAILFITTFVEGLAEYLFQGSKNIKFIALFFGVMLAIAYQIDIPAMVGLGGIPVVNWIVSGILIGRGSNYVSDIIGKFKKA